MPFPLADLLAQVIGTLVALVILVRAEPAISRMGPATPALIRLAFVLLAAGAAWALIAILTGTVPPWPLVVIAAGAAVLLLCDRRIRLLTRLRHFDKGAHHASR